MMSLKRPANRWAIAFIAALIAVAFIFVTSQAPQPQEVDQVMREPVHLLLRQNVRSGPSEISHATFHQSRVEQRTPILTLGSEAMALRANLWYADAILLLPRVTAKNQIELLQYRLDHSYTPRVERRLRLNADWIDALGVFPDQRLSLIAWSQGNVSWLTQWPLDGEPEDLPLEGRADGVGILTSGEIVVLDAGPDSRLRLIHEQGEGDIVVDQAHLMRGPEGHLWCLHRADGRTHLSLVETHDRRLRLSKIASWSLEHSIHAPAAVNDDQGVGIVYLHREPVNDFSSASVDWLYRLGLDGSVKRARTSSFDDHALLGVIASRSRDPATSWADGLP
jgi:hypothetical protein